jgi:arylsulfatase A-like enzyme
MDQPNIVFIVLDAVRADHVSWYGYDRETTPTFDMLAENGVGYRNAFSPSVWTPTVHGSIWTGEYPSHNGVYTGDLSLPDDRSVLPELLSEAGYRTFATSSGAHLRRDRGYARGFDEFVETYRIQPDREFLRKFVSDSSYRKQVGFSLSRGPDDKTLYKFDRMRRFIEKTNDRPFFCFFNCKTAHQPWNPPRPYKEMWGPDIDRPRYELIERLLMAAGREPLSIEGQDMERIRRFQQGHPVLTDQMELTDEEWDLIEAWYDGAIRYLDDRVGSFVDYLKETGQFQNTLFVLTADHGDQFGDHGLSGHVFSIYDALLHVPLAISPPVYECDSGTEIDAQVTLVDLHKTFLEAAGVDPDEYPLTTSLRPWKERTYHDYTFAEYAYPARTLSTIQNNHPEFDPKESGYDRSLRAVRDDEYKLILGSDGERSLYRWRDDPDETTNVSSEHPDIVDRLEAVVEEQLGTLQKRGKRDEQISGDVEDQLERLGYM